MYALLILCFFLYFPHAFVNKLASKNTENKKVLFAFSLYTAAFSALTGLIVALVEGATFSFDLVTVLTSFLFGIMLAVCQIATFYSMQVTSVAVSNMSATASVIIPCFVGMLFFNEGVTVGKILGIAIFLIAAYLIIAKDRKNKQHSFSAKTLFACLLVFLTNGLGSIAMQLFAEYSVGVSDSVFMFYSYVLNTLTLLVFVLCLQAKNKQAETEGKVVFPSKLFILGLLISAITFFLQQINVVLANEIPSTILFPILKSGKLILGATVGWMFFKEKLSVKNIIGIALAIVALVVLNF